MYFKEKNRKRKQINAKRNKNYRLNENWRWKQKKKREKVNKKMFEAEVVELVFKQFSFEQTLAELEFNRHFYNN